MDTFERNHSNRELQAKPDHQNGSQSAELPAVVPDNSLEVDSIGYSLKNANFIVGYDEGGRPMTARALRTIEGMPNRLLRVDFPKIESPAVGWVIDSRTRNLERLDPAQQQEYLLQSQKLRNEVFTELRDKYGIGIPKFWSWIGRQNLGEGQSRLGSFALVEKVEGVELTDSNIPEEAIPAITDCFSRLGAYYLDKAKNMNWGAYFEDIQSVPSQFHYSKEEKKLYMLAIGMEGIAPAGDWDDSSKAMHMGGKIWNLIFCLRYLEQNRFKKEVFTDLEEQLRKIQEEIDQIANSYRAVGPK